MPESDSKRKSLQYSLHCSFSNCSRCLFANGFELAFFEMYSAVFFKSYADTSWKSEVPESKTGARPCQSRVAASLTNPKLLKCLSEFAIMQSTVNIWQSCFLMLSMFFIPTASQHLKKCAYSDSLFPLGSAFLMCHALTNSVSPVMKSLQAE